MFADKKEKTEQEPGTGQNRINEGTKLKGDIHSNGFFRIDGTIEGNISTPSKVVLGKTGVITGTLNCENADIEGTFNGNLDVSGTLTLRATAKIEGDVVVGKLAVEPGATLNASCSMKGVNKSNKEKPKTTEENAKVNPYDRQQRTKQASPERSS